MLLVVVFEGSKFNAVSKRDRHFTSAKLKLQSFVFSRMAQCICYQRFFSHWSLLIAKRKPRCDMEFIGSAPCLALVRKLVQ
jgi:hypothetical protein